MLIGLNTVTKLGLVKKYLDTSRFQLEDLHRTNYRTLSVLVLLSLTHGQKALATLKLPLDNLVNLQCWNIM